MIKKRFFNGVSLVFNEYLTDRDLDCIKGITIKPVIDWKETK